MKMIEFSEEKYKQLKKAAQEYIDYVNSKNLNEDYLEKYLHEIGERTLIFLFGPEIFGYVDHRLDETWEKEHGGKNR